MKSGKEARARTGRRGEVRGKEGKYGLYEREGVCKRLKREKKNLLNTKGGRGKSLDKDLGDLYQSFGIDSFPLCFLCFAARTDFSGVGLVGSRSSLLLSEEFALWKRQSDFKGFLT